MPNEISISEFVATHQADIDMTRNTFILAVRTSNQLTATNAAMSLAIAAASNRAYNSLPYTGGTLTGPLVIEDTIAVQGNSQFEGNMNINGDLRVLGNATYINTETLVIEDNMILLNSSLSNNAPDSNLQSGIEISRGTESNMYFIYDEESQLFMIGDAENLQGIATRTNNVAPNTIAYWNDTMKQYDFNSNIVILNSRVGINTSNPQYTLDVNGDLRVSGACTLSNTVDVYGTLTAHSNMLVHGHIDMGLGTVGGDTDIAGGPFFVQSEGWSDIDTSHIILYPLFCKGDNSSGKIDIHASTKNDTVGSRYIGHISLSFIKCNGSPLSILTVNTHTDGDGPSILTLNATVYNSDSIQITLNYPCRIAWTSIGAY